MSLTVESDEKEMWLMVVQSGLVTKDCDPPHEEGTYLSRTPLPELLRIEIRGGSELEVSAIASHCLS